MGLFSNRRIRQAAGHRNEIDLSSRVVSTIDFGQVQPVFARETVPGDQWHINIGQFCRLSPMPVPTFAGMKMSTRAFYVRFRSAWKGWDDFYAQRAYVNEAGQDIYYSKVPTFTNSEFISQFSSMSHLCKDVTGQQDVPVDMTYRLPTRTIDLQLTYDGRKCLNTLRGLGYSFNWTYEDNTEMSMLPLLCYFRAFYDYYLPSKYTNTHDLREIFANPNPDLQSVMNLFYYDVFTAFFDNDYFTASWTNPNTPTNDANHTQFVLSDPSPLSPGEPSYATANFSNQNSGQNGLAFLNVIPSRPRITQYGLDALNAVYSWGMRKGLGGNRYFETIFSQFGIKLPDVQVNRSIYLGSNDSVVQISDVMSTADTAGAGEVSNLGAYAGKGIAYSENGKISCECNDFGMIIILSHLVPETGYVQGRNREIMHKSVLDFFNPEFDRLGMQPVRNDELYADFTDGTMFASGQSHGGRPDGIFGYTPQYSEYKKGIDLLNGDFRGKLEGTFDSYHSFRMFMPPSSNYPLTNTKYFRIIDPQSNGSSFDRIFSFVGNDIDHFITTYAIKAKAYRKMASIKDSFKLDGGETVTVDPDCQLHS